MKERLLLMHGLNMLIRYGTCVVPTFLAPRLSWAAFDELGLQVVLRREDRRRSRVTVRER